MDDSIGTAARLLRESRSAVAFTGAGISAESGIPTFRGEGGLWRRYDPAKVASIDYFLADPSAYWTAARERGAAAQRARPNAAHLTLAALERDGRLAGVVTQNTDGLHQDAGSERVVELHGSGRWVECLDCGAKEARAQVQARLDGEMPPRCRVCGGPMLKPTVVLFGESLPAAAFAQAQDLARRCDLMLVIGTSLAVFPAAGLPVEALRAGARLVIVNAEETPLDARADSVLRGRAAELLPRLSAGG